MRIRHHYFSIIVLTMLSCNVSKRHQNNAIAKLKIDTLSGYFLYEVNVPDLCYTIGDQIEQDHYLIFYTDNFKKSEVFNCYKKGILIFNHPSFFDKYKLVQYKQTIINFRTDFNKSSYLESKFNQTLLFDKSGLLTYKKIYAKIVVAELGKIDILVPDTKNFNCCFANKKVKNKAYFVQEFISYKFL